MPSLNEWSAEIHRNAVEHGFWDTDLTLPHRLMLCVSELSEAMESHRAGEEAIWWATPDGRHAHPHYVIFDSQGRRFASNGDGPLKPEGWVIEAIDCLIRLLDLLDEYDLDTLVEAKHAYNKTRPRLHGKAY